MNGPDLSRAQWRKSSRSSGSGACVEVAVNLPGVVAVRDSKHPDGGVLMLAPQAFATLTAKVRAGSFDLA